MKQVIALLTVGGIVLLILFTLTWLFQLRTKNAGIVDTIWSVSFPLLAVIYFFRADGYLPRQSLIAIMAVAWGLRLASYLLFRTMGHREDSRYKALRESWGDKQNILMLRFFYFQAVLALILSLPFALTIFFSPGGWKNVHPYFHPS